MSMPSYQDMLAAVERGVFVAVAFGSTHRGPAVGWVMFPLDEEGDAIARSPHLPVRAAQGLGFVAHLGRAGRSAGFTPA